MTDTADLVVIGGGIIGVTVALKAAQQALGRIVLLEGSQIAAGGTGLSTGVVRQFYLLPELVAMAREGIDWYQNFGEHVDGRSAGFVNSGLVVCGTDAQRARFQTGVDLQRGFGSTSRVLSEPELTKLIGGIDTRGIECAYFEPEAGYADPGLACLAIAQAAGARKVEIRQGDPATAIQADSAGVREVITGKGEKISTRAVLNAAGPRAGRISAWLGIDLPIRPTRHSVVTIRWPADLPRCQPVLSDATSLFYLRPAAADQVLIGSTSPADSRAPVDPDSYLASCSLDEISVLLERVVGRFPAIQEAPVLSSYAGIYDETPDGFPVLGEAAAVPGFYLAAGLSGHGFKLAPAIARLTVSAIAGRPEEPAARLLRASRFAEGGQIDSPTTTTLTAMRAEG